jgi:hypothetical protein
MSLYFGNEKVGYLAPPPPNFSKKTHRAYPMVHWMAHLIQLAETEGTRHVP